jgi:NAD(P)-dependent dehydrogenase (short-subunit alcohol dehydrogenase family)
MTQSNLDVSKEFAGRRALVTGGSRGIGAAAAQRLLDAGARVVVSARSRHAETPAGATFVEGDLRTEAGANSIGAKALAALGGLDILVNNAGGTRVHLPNSEAISDAEWVEALNLNFLSAVRLTYSVLEALREGTSASITNVSAGGVLPMGGAVAHYGAAKAALNNFTRNLAKELAPARIRVNIVTPGPVTTPGGDEGGDLLTKAMGITHEAFFAQVPLGRAGRSAEVAEMIAFLASPRGEWITGHNHYVDGGWAELKG